MSATAIMVDDTTGEIKRKVTGDPAMFGSQRGAGEYLFALTDYDGQSIDDANLIISESGEWEAKEGSPVDLPPFTIEYIAA